eukprot:g44270.t1
MYLDSHKSELNRILPQSSFWPLDCGCVPSRRVSGLGGAEVRQLLLRPLWSFSGDQIGRSTNISAPLLIVPERPRGLDFPSMEKQYHVTTTI